LSRDSVSFSPAELPLGKLVLSTEDARYGGDRRNGDPFERLSPYELLVFDKG
jgi:hypothetical protein